LPIRMGILTLHSLGKISLLPSYHNQQYIWPIGYKISRQVLTYLSIVNPSGNTTYVCSIEDNGHAGPKFQIIAEDCPHHTIIGNSATEVWTIIVRRANEIRNNPYSGTASGPDYYGLTQPVITQMIQDLPNANQCKNYIWKHF
ncbi:F/Y rich C-terminus-domain-containing protein, partial [Gilbertella persicaria]|uniref:F/Y rich C-terminus-domain-containing protein n=1 Tax=Gilbertella persicaria TaxID=101096 RepID=UPI00221E6401